MKRIAMKGKTSKMLNSGDSRENAHDRSSLRRSSQKQIPKKCILLAVLVSMIHVNSSPALAADLKTHSQGGAGQVVEDNSGNAFMEEVVDTDKWNDEEQKKKSDLERSPLTEQQLIDNGLQVTPSGHLIPLINRGAPPIQEQGTRFTSSFEPIYPGYVVSPVPYGGNPYNPYAPTPYGYPIPGGYSANPPAVSGFPYAGMPIGSPFGGFGGYGNPLGGYGGFGGYGNPLGGFRGIGNLFGGGFGGYGNISNGLTYGNPIYGSPGLAGGFGQPWLSRLINRPYYGAPYAPLSPYNYGYSPGAIITSPSYSYTWDSTAGAPATPPSSFSSSGSILSRPFWSGYAGRGLLGGFQGGASLNLPSTTTYDSTTTFTPIPPGSPTDPE